MDSLFSPWRYSYLIQEKKDEGCVFCAALAAPGNDEGSLVVYRGRRNFVILNLYPYNNGHMMIVPNEHVASPADSTPAQRAEMTDLSVVGEQVIRALFKPEGINVGMNLGRAAGAGIEEHFHLHMVPRWSGDTNFMTVMAGTRVIPEDLRETRARLRREFLERLGPESGSESSKGGGS